MDGETERLLALARMSQEDFHNRRQLEWRLGFATWLAIVAFTAGFFATDDLHIPNDIPLGMILLAYFLLLTLSIVTQVFIQVAHWRTLRYYFYFRSLASGWKEEAANYLKIGPDGHVTRVGETTWKPLGLKEYAWVPFHWWWLAIHVGVTVFLMGLSFLLIWHVKHTSALRPGRPTTIVAPSETTLNSGERDPALPETVPETAGSREDSTGNGNRRDDGEGRQ